MKRICNRNLTYTFSYFFIFALIMELLYFATIYAAATVCIITSLLIFLRREEGDRSRTILAIIILFSVANYITHFLYIYQEEIPERVTSVNMLLIAIFMVTSYIAYPIEVISPGYLNIKRVINLYIPLLLLAAITIIANLCGIEFTEYNTLPEMLPNITHFEVWFRIVLVFLLFTPVIIIFIIPHTRIFNNTDKVWMRKFLILFIINTIAYLMVLIFSSKEVIIKIIYYCINVACIVTISYMEVFERLIRKPNIVENNKEISFINKPSIEVVNAENISTSNKNRILEEDEDIEPADNNTIESLSDKIVNYIHLKRSWEDPDITAMQLYIDLKTNRTTFGKAIKNIGYDNFAIYINTLRVNDFIERINSGKYTSYLETFYDVGFRSRSSAFRNFKLITGETPSEYFQNRQ